jgi:hypothetical protein
VWIATGTVECKSLYVYDVKTGHIKVKEQAVPPVNTSTSTLISSIVVKANGSVAWSGGEQTGPGQVDYQVQTDDSTGTGPVTVDHGDDIAPESLGKASDGLSIYWIRGGGASVEPAADRRLDALDDLEHQYRGRLAATSIAMPPPARTNPTTRKPIPTHSTAVVFAPSFTSALTRGAPVAFIATISQSPPDTFQVVVTRPAPVLDASQKRCAPGGPAGAPPACRS